MSKKVVRYFVASFLTGLSFAILDGFINGNPYAVKLMEPFDPITKSAINIPVGVLIDLIYGFIISGIFMVISPALPTGSGIMKGLTYGLGMWFFRGLMSVISYWMMFDIPLQTLIYILVAGLVEMLLLGVLNGLIIKSENRTELRNA